MFNYFILKDNTNIAANLFEDNADKLNEEEFYDYMNYNIVERKKDKSIMEGSLNEKNNIGQKDIIKDVSLEKDITLKKNIQKLMLYLKIVKMI